jgi:hypothetical protein
VVAPLAVAYAVPPVHIYSLDGVTVIVGVAVTVKVTVFWALHTPVVPVTVYTIVVPVVVLLVGLLAVVLLNPVAGLQV